MESSPFTQSPEIFNALEISVCGIMRSNGGLHIWFMNDHFKKMTFLAEAPKIPFKAVEVISLDQDFTSLKLDLNWAIEIPGYHRSIYGTEEVVMVGKSFTWSENSLSNLSMLFVIPKLDLLYNQEVLADMLDQFMAQPNHGSPELFQHVYNLRVSIADVMIKTDLFKESVRNMLALQV
jgi:hypothetical protein